MRAWIIASIVLLVAGASVASFVGWKVWHRRSAVEQPAALITVKPMDLRLTINSTGNLDAVRKLEVVCLVEGRSTIKTIIPEGTEVKEGDLLVELDASELVTRFQTAEMEFQKSESEDTWAKEQISIQQAKNVEDIASAEVELKLAELTMREYVEGVYPQKLYEARKSLESAQVALNSATEKWSQTKGLLSKGFSTQMEVEDAQHLMVEKQIDMQKKKNDLQVLEEYTRAKELADKENKVAQGRNKLARVRAESESSMNAKQAEMQAKAQALVIRRDAYERLKRQVANCRIYAPGTGMVVYSRAFNRFMGDEQPLGAGAQVMERQPLVTLPDTSEMKIDVGVGETDVSKLAGKAVQFPVTINLPGRREPLTGKVQKVSILPDNQNMFWNPDQRKYPVEVSLDRTPPDLKPGMTAKVEIEVRVIRDVLAVPTASIYTVGEKSWVFVERSGRVEPVPVQLGEATATHVQVVQGIVAGDVVWQLQAGQGQRMLEALNQRTGSIPATVPGDSPPPAVRAAAPNDAPTATGTPAAAT